MKTLKIAANDRLFDRTLTIEYVNDECYIAVDQHSPHRNGMIIKLDKGQLWQLREFLNNL